MSNTIIALNKSDNTVAVELEFRYAFIFEVLTQMGLPIEKIWVEPTLSAEQRLKLVSLLNQYEVSVYEDIDGVVEIFAGSEQVGKWDRPTFSFKRDLSINDKEKSIYVEMTTNYWSLYHDGNPDE